MAKHGMDSREAIDFPNVGRLDPGLRVDLLVVEGNPLEDATTIADSVCVIQAGEIVAGRLPADENG